MTTTTNRPQTPTDTSPLAAAMTLILVVSQIILGAFFFLQSLPGFGAVVILAAIGEACAFVYVPSNSSV